MQELYQVDIWAKDKIFDCKNLVNFFDLPVELRLQYKFKFDQFDIMYETDS